MTKEKTDAPTGTNGHKSFFQRLAALLPLGRAPETTEALELEIQELLEEGEEQGLISSLEERMINSIFDFHDTLAVEVMTPSTEIVSAEESTPISDLVDLVIEKGFTRIPIYREKPDTIVGILHAKDLLKVCARGDNEKGVKGLLSPPYV
ncbi:MAG: CBS domain-containing protein, partial [Proteobacteria bacterium]|nr:CBS domain-containing protein [Pseudomonadota bacterium]